MTQAPYKNLNRQKHEMFNSLFDKSVDVNIETRGDFTLARRRKIHATFQLEPVTDDVIMTQHYENYLIIVAEIALPITGTSTQWQTNARTEAGCINWVKTGYNKWRHDHTHEALPMMPVVPVATAHAAEPSGVPKPHKEGGHPHPVRLKAAELPQTLMQMLKTDWATVESQRESFQLALAGAQHLKDMVSIAYHAYDCTQMADNIEDDAWTEKAWTMFMFEITDAIMARPPGIRQMLKYVLDHPAAADPARACRWICVARRRPNTPWLSKGTSKSAP
jgi:hypothetical protein